MQKLKLEGDMVPRHKQRVRSILSKCIVCKRVNSKPFSYPDTPALPDARNNFVRPFATTGMDFSSHFWVHDPFGYKQKVY